MRNQWRKIFSTFFCFFFTFQSNGEGVLSPSVLDRSNSEALETIGSTALSKKQDLISVHLKKAFLKDFLSYLSSHYNINFVFSEEIGKKTISIKFKETPLNEALNAILEIHALGLTKLSNNIIHIETLVDIQKKKEELKKAKLSSTLLIPTKISIFRLSYARAETIAPVVTELLSASSSNDPRVKVQANERANSLIVEAIPSDLEKVYGLIKRMDLQTPQVKIETRIIEVLKNTNNSLGINWTAPLRVDKGRGIGFGNLIFPNNMLSNFSIDTGATTITGGKFDTHFGSINNSMELDLKLRLSEINKITRSLQNNSVIVLNNEPASISAGQTDFFAYTKGGANADTVLEQVDFNLKLDVTPHITADGSVQMKIRLENSKPTAITAVSENAATSRNTRVIDTSLIRKSGETAVIGGLYNVQTTKSVTGLPVLSRIPILSVFFSTTIMREDKTELIILVTPTIINTEKAFSFTGEELDDAQRIKEKSNFYESNSNERLEEALTKNQINQNEKLLLEEVEVEDSFENNSSLKNENVLDTSTSSANEETPFNNNFEDILENNESFEKINDINEENIEDFNLNNF